MTTMNTQMIASINSALLFLSDGEYETPQLRPWQYVQMEYERVGLKPPQRIPDFESFEDAEYRSFKMGADHSWWTKWFCQHCEGSTGS